MRHESANTKQADPGGKASLPHVQGSRFAAPPALHPALQLQQQAGNQAMQELLRSGLIRAKLEVSQPGDPEEQEADEVAGRIMRSAAGVGAAASSACSCGSGEEEMCDECRQKAATISRKATDSGSKSHGSNPSSHGAGHVLSAMRRSAGSPLDGAARAFFEPRFGRDFSAIRIHTDSPAAASARAIHAHAFTTGRSIYFAPGQYSPQTEEGRRLLAHELTHTLQQPAAGAEPLRESGALPTRPRHTSDAETDSESATAIHETTVSGKLNREEGQNGGAAKPAPEDGGKQPDLDAGVPPPSGGAAAAPAGPLIFKGIPISSDGPKLVAEIEGYFAEHGLDEGRDLGPQFESELQTLQYNRQDTSGTSDSNDPGQQRLAQMEEVAPAFRSALADVDRQSTEFLTTFDAKAHSVLSEMLTASQDRVMSERERYGLTKTVTEKQRWGHDEGSSFEEPTFESTYGMAANNATSGLADAAKGLAGKAQEVRTQMDLRNDKTPISFGETVAEEDWAPYRAADLQVQQKVGEYNVLKFKSDNDYPILASFDVLDTTGTWFVDQTIKQLTGFADRSPEDTAETLYNDTDDKLANIAKVTDAVAQGDLQVWKLAPVVSLTLQQIDLLPAKLQERLVHDKGDQISPGEILDMALGVLAIALGALAAIPTGGSSLAAGVAVAAGVGSAALGGYFAIEHIQKYSLEAAAKGTDFDRARAVSETEPSLFWLAVDIIGAMGGAAADLHAAASTFKALSVSLREASELRQLAQEGQRLAEADAALAKLKQEGDNVAPGLGEKLAGKIGKDGVALEKEAGIGAWKDSLSPESRAFLVDNPGERAIYEDMDEELRWLCTHCSNDCLIKGLTREQSARIRDLAENMNKEQLDALHSYLHLNKGDVEGAITEIEGQMAKRSFHERNSSVFEPEDNSSFSKVDAPDVPQGQRLPRGTEKPDPEIGGYWGGETRGDGPYFSDIPEVNQVTGYKPIPFRDGFPDFSPWASERVHIPVTGNDAADFALADELMAKKGGFKNKTAYKNWRSKNALTWHHVEGAEEMILVPRALHENVPHIGGASQARAVPATTP